MMIYDETRYFDSSSILLTDIYKGWNKSLQMILVSNWATRKKTH